MHYPITATAKLVPSKTLIVDKIAEINSFTTSTIITNLDKSCVYVFAAFVRTEVHSKSGSSYNYIAVSFSTL